MTITHFNNQETAMIIQLGKVSKETKGTLGGMNENITSKTRFG